MISTEIRLPSGVSVWQIPNLVWHREDGPAVIYRDNSYSWHLLGDEFFFDDYCDELRRNYGKTDEDIMLLRMQYDTD